MDRRNFLILSGAAALVPGLAQAEISGLAYTPGLVADRLAKGETVFIDFYTDWCSTCRSQGRTIEALRKATPAYDKHITFVKIDWDQFSGAAISKKYKIPRRSTLIMLKGDQELGRIVAGTRRDDIKALLDSGLPSNA